MEMSTSSQHYSQWKSLHHQWQTVVNDKQWSSQPCWVYPLFSKATGLFVTRTSFLLHFWSSKLVKLPRPHEISFEPISWVITELMEKYSDGCHNTTITSNLQGIPFEISHLSYLQKRNLYISGKTVFTLNQSPDHSVEVHNETSLLE